MTTNWDTVFENELKKIVVDDHDYKANIIEVHYLHGNIHNGNLIYLPSEIVDEPYRTDEEKKYFWIGTQH